MHTRRANQVALFAGRHLRRCRQVCFACLVLLLTALRASPGPDITSANAIKRQQDRDHWSFRPLHQPAPSTGTSAAAGRNPVDAFIEKSLAQRQLAFSRPADGLTLVRRIYFDLAGLPPTPGQVDSFVLAHSRNPDQAVAGLVDELLASPHYGERWARHWLDVARYADSNGQEGDQDRPTAYHYRDFVIRALNDDLPYTSFVKWQIAGDEFEPENPLAVAATGFIVAGPHTVLDVPMEEEKVRNRYNELDDMMATTGAAMLGLTLGCARCHDHKYDPIPTRDYYRLLCAFNSGNRAEVPLVMGDALNRHRDAEQQWKASTDVAQKNLKEWLEEVRKTHAPALRETKINALNASAAEKEMLRGDLTEPAAVKLAKKFAKELKIDDNEFRLLVSEEQRREWTVLEKAVQEAAARKPAPLPTAHAFKDFAPEPKETFLLARGDFHLPREPVQLGFLTALSGQRTAGDYWAAAKTQRRRADSTQQRRALAEWLTDTDHGAGALAARVMVNRVWQHHFGEGLVRTVNDFGTQGDKPSHPELLEWLTAEFVRNGWKLKPLHRLLLTSRVYRQASTFDAEKAKMDPDERLLWRWRPQRLEAEVLRDSVLAVSGGLNREMYGPAFKPHIAAEAIQARNLKDPYPSGIKDTPVTRRRTIYMFHKRVVQHPLMQVFDGPDASASCGRRERTTVAPQALAMLNDRFVRMRAEDFARRLAVNAPDRTTDQVHLAWRLALGRPPSASESAAASTFVDTQSTQRRARDQDQATARHQALTDFSQALFAMNEFIYVD